MFRPPLIETTRLHSKTVLWRQKLSTWARAVTGYISAKTLPQGCTNLVEPWPTPKRTVILASEVGRSWRRLGAFLLAALFTDHLKIEVKFRETVNTYGCLAKRSRAHDIL